MVVVLIYSAQESEVNRHSCLTLPCMTFVYNGVFFEFLHFSQQLWPDLKIHRNDKHQFYGFSVVYSGRWDSGRDSIKYSKPIKWLNVMLEFNQDNKLWDYACFTEKRHRKSYFR